MSGSFTWEQAAGAAPAVGGAGPQAFTWDEAAKPAEEVQAPQQRGGLARNVAAALPEAGADVINTASDPLGNIVGKPVAVGLTALHDFFAPVFGYQKFTPEARSELLGDTVPQPGTKIVNSVGRAIGAPTPDQVPSNTDLEYLARLGTRGAADLAAFGVAGSPASAARTAAIAAPVGAASTVGGELASRAVPEEYAPLVNMMTQFGLGAGAYATVAGGRAALNSAKPTIQRTIDPFTEAGRQRLAAQRVANAATDINAVKQSLENPQPELVPGSQPTTFQATGDQGLGNLERAVAKENPDLFLERANQQNAARVGAIEGTAPANASPEAVGAAFRKQLAALDAQNDAAVQAAQGGVNQSLGAVGGQQTFSPDQQATALQQYGQKLRSGLVAQNDAARAAEAKLWQAIDPDGSLRVDMSPVRNTAASIAKELPQNAAPMTGEEAAIFNVARLQPQVQSFSELGALRSRITDAMRQELSTNGRTPAYGRLSKLLDSVSDTLQSGVEQKAGEEAASGGISTNGGLVGGAPLLDNTGAGVRGAVSGGDTGPIAAPIVSERFGPQNAGGQGGGLGASDSGLALAPAARGRQPESLVDFLIAKGGVQDQTGDLKAIGADTIHHRAGGRLVNARGLTPDYARELAEGEGFKSPLSGSMATIRDLYDAITEHSSGRPVYRPEEAHMADVARQSAREVDQEAIARSRAEKAVSYVLNQPGMDRLRQPEYDHAVTLVMQGEHPESAVLSAARGGDEAALQRNAEKNAIGSPGMPLAEQESMALAGAGLPANFDAAAAARYAAARNATAERHATFTKAPGVGEVLRPGARSGEFRMAESQVPSNLFKSGAGAAERVKAFVKAGGNAADLKDYAAFSMRNAAVGKDGAINERALNQWLKAHREALDAAKLSKDFSKVADAQRSLDEAVSRKVEARKAYEDSAASHFLGDADPVAKIGKILKSDTALATMKELARLTQNDPAARAGLKRSVVEFIKRDLIGNAAAGDTGTNILKSDAFQTFVKKTPAALRTIFSEEELKTIKNVAADLQRANKSIAGTKLPGGSNTAQDTAAGIKHGSHKPSLLNSLVLMEAGGEAMHHLMGGLGKVAGMIGVPVFNAMKEAGMEHVDDLVTQAMLHPELARTLLTHLPEAKSAPAVGKILANQIRAISMSAAVQSGNRRPEPAFTPRSIATPSSAPRVSAGVSR